MQVRILIADDSPLARNTLRGLLESHSPFWKVCAEAGDGMQAVQKAFESRPDIIILDLQMPFLDGMTSAARISKFLPQVPILIHTIHKSRYLDGEAQKAGVYQVISKGFPEILIATVEKLSVKRITDATAEKRAGPPQGMETAVTIPGRGARKKHPLKIIGS